LLEEEDEDRVAVVGGAMVDRKERKKEIER
jgi:hypothetical protein